MKKVFVSLEEHFYEKRGQCDFLDQRWYKIFKKLDLLPILIPNHVDYTRKMIKSIECSGIFLIGGGTISEISQKITMRDCVEDELLRYAVDSKIPLIGICRGMQKIAAFFGSSFYKIKNHVDCMHEININNKKLMVNSFHEYSIKYDSISSDFEIKGYSMDGVIEHIAHKYLPMVGMMWHPERFETINSTDIHIMKNVLNV